ncbi:hypothetical protein N7493_011570 [Penicillium malachiteum]|uniref:FAD-binding domain-containing protein n=1 Tax=Penicillium malachiteum TaxID=1324776 RepID=A0AAD6HAW7_9EURO|nr:hypothetical protein N7493_011570 [Penicillium malachiteum]
MSNLRVLIVGASIAGPTAAYWLGKAGANVTVIERFPQLRMNGQNIDIRTVGVSVMRKIPGMEAAVRSKLVPMDGASIVGRNGRPYGTLWSTGNPDQQSMISEFEILRGDLGKILHDKSNEYENVKYVFGEQVVSIHTDSEDGPITVKFMNGYPTTEYDLIVACDGAMSRTRAICFGCNVRDHIRPTNAWAVYYSVQQDFLNGSTVGEAYSAPGGRMIAIGPDSPGVNRLTLMNNGVESTRRFRAAKASGTDTLKEFVASHYKGMGWRCEEAMQGMLEAKDFYGSEIVQVKMPSLSKGRFVLVGDAGYAGGPTGNGTSLAMAGAYILAGEIAKCEGDVAVGLKAYEEQMRPLIAELTKIPPLVLTVIAPQTVCGVWLRNWIFAFIYWSRILDLVQRFFGASFSNSEQYKVPEYEWAE